MKKDMYSRARGGWSKLFDIHCTNCKKRVLRYQKDGVGQLLRCYLNRIIAPPHLETLQYDPKIQEPRDMPNLTCPQCSTLIGTPMRHEDGRLAFRLLKGKHSKQKAEGV